MNRRYIFAIFIFFSFIALTGNAAANEPKTEKTVIHLGILNDTNYTRNPEYDWIAKGSLEIATTRLAYMNNLMLIPLPDEFMQNPFYVSLLPELDVNKGLSAIMGNGTNNKPYLAFMLKDLSTGRSKEIVHLPGYPSDILLALPKAIPMIAEAIGYTPTELERRRASSYLTNSVDAWKNYTSALYTDMTEGPLNKALKADPQFSEAQAKLAMLLLMQNKTDEANTVFRESLKQKPYLYTALAGMSLIYEERGNSEESVKYADAIMDANLRNSFAYVNWNLDQARGTSIQGSSSGYDRLGTDAALAAIESPVTFHGAFEYLKNDIRQVDTLKATLKSPYPLISLLSMAQHGQYGISVDTSTLAEHLNSNSILIRTLATEALLSTANRKNCPSAIESLKSSTQFDSTDMQQQEIKQELIASITMAIILKCDDSYADDINKLVISTDNDIKIAASIILGAWGSRDHISTIARAVGNRYYSHIAAKALKASAGSDDLNLIKMAIKSNKRPVLYTIIASFDTPEAYDYLESSIYDSDYYNPIDALKQSGSSRGLLAILNATSSQDARIRSEATAALGDMPWAKEAIPVLIALTKDSNKTIQVKAVSSLSKIAGKDTKDLLMNILNNEKTNDIARSFIALDYKHLSTQDLEAAMVNSGTNLKQAVLGRLLKDDIQAFYRAFETHVSIHDTKTMRYALNMIASKAKKNTPSNARKIQEIALKAIASKDGELTIPAARTLGALGLKKSIPTLTDALLRSTSLEEKYHIASALGHIRDRSSANALEALLKNKNEAVKLIALIPLVNIGDRHHIDTIIELARESGKFQETILTAHDQLQDHLLIPPLTEGLTILTDQDYTITALDELGAIDKVYGYLSNNHNEKIFRSLRINKYYNGNLEILTNAKDKYARATGYYLMTMKAQDTKDHKWAIKYAGKCVKYANKVHEPMLAAAALTLKAKSETFLNKDKKALKSLKKALKYIAKTTVYEREDSYNDILLIPEVHLLLGKGYAYSGKEKLARLHLAEAVRTAVISESVRSADIIIEARQAQFTIVPAE